MKYHYYRVWQGDTYDCWELTNGLFGGKKGCLKAKDIEHAIAQVYDVYIGAKYRHFWEDTGEGDDTLAILECVDVQHKEDCPMSQDADADCDCEPSIEYIEIVEPAIESVLKS